MAQEILIVAHRSQHALTLKLSVLSVLYYCWACINLPRLSPWLLSACFLRSLQADQNQESAPLPTNEYKITPIRICCHGKGDIDSGTAGSML